mmetsp:Transcript_37113/g.80816  ORF Transcript_37113/g.80816 Transcript_37113/m.80816 type:complete len:281 (+) Transcript_37113:84-926(+)
MSAARSPAPSSASVPATMHAHTLTPVCRSVCATSFMDSGRCASDPSGAAAPPCTSCWVRNSLAERSRGEQSATRMTTRAAAVRQGSPVHEFFSPSATPYPESSRGPFGSTLCTPTFSPAQLLVKGMRVLTESRRSSASFFSAAFFALTSSSACACSAACGMPLYVTTPIWTLVHCVSSVTNCTTSLLPPPPPRTRVRAVMPGFMASDSSTRKATSTSPAPRLGVQSESIFSGGASTSASSLPSFLVIFGRSCTGISGSASSFTVNVCVTSKCPGALRMAS